MIQGLVDLLTTCVAKGWVSDDADPRAVVHIRVCAGEAVLAEMVTNGPVVIGQGTLRHQFHIALPSAQRSGKISDMRIEAARQGSEDWCALPRYPAIPPYPRGGRPDQPETALAFLGAEPGQSVPLAQRGFWSDSTTHTVVAAEEARPVFVLGAARSGTSAISAALTTTTRYRGFSEGHVLDIGIRLVNALAAHFELKHQYLTPPARAAYQLGRFPHEWFSAQIIEILRRVAGSYTTPHWLDKTPTRQMVASVPLLAEAWPNARFIFMKRRGIENLASRVRKFQGMKFFESCRDWAVIMSDWRIVRQTVQGKCIELDQRDLLDDPSSAAALAGKLLSLQPEEIASLAAALRNERPEVTDTSNRIYADMTDTGWSSTMIDTFHQMCDQEMTSYGYTYDARYRE